MITNKSCPNLPPAQIPHSHQAVWPLPEYPYLSPFLGDSTHQDKEGLELTAHSSDCERMAKEVGLD
jgi:hypothetical protein